MGIVLVDPFGDVTIEMDEHCYRGAIEALNALADDLGYWYPGLAELRDALDPLPEEDED